MIEHENQHARRDFVVNGERLSRDSTWFEAAVERARDALQLEQASKSGLPDWDALARIALLAALEER